MKNFLILHYGFEKPTSEEMSKWNNWFKSIADRQVDRGGLGKGLVLSESGKKELPFGKDSITGYTIIEAKTLDEAETIVADCPTIAGTRVYEIRK